MHSHLNPTDAAPVPQLPNDVLMQIFLQIPFTDLKQVSLVNKQFAELIAKPIFWKFYYQHTFPQFMQKILDENPDKNVIDWQCEFRHTYDQYITPLSHVEAFNVRKAMTDYLATKNTKTLSELDYQNFAAESYVSYDQFKSFAKKFDDQGLHDFLFRQRLNKCRNRIELCYQGNLLLSAFEHHQSDEVILSLLNAESIANKKKFDA